MRKRGGARLGQHFLKNPVVARAVAHAAGVSDGDTVFEIGPGTGMLTRELLRLGTRVTAVEKDSLMVTALQQKFGAEIREEKLELQIGDVRDVAKKLPYGNFFATGQTYRVAANIPYYITGELLRMCLTAKNQPRSIAFLVQKEVAERIARSKKESILSLSVKAYGTPRYVRTVSRGNFAPAPNVDSAILSITDISRKNFEKVSEEKFFRVVKAGFAQKRKTLSGNLKRVFGERALGALAACGIPEKARAEDVTIEKWLRLASKL